jgi:putative lipoprotein LpqV
MRSYPLCVAAAAAALAIAGCSSGGEGAKTSSAAPTPTTATSSETHTPAPGAFEVSPGGVTTAVGADAESTEDEYSQACQAAKTWIDQQGGDRKSQVEPYLKMIQDPNTPPGPATYNTPWAQLSPARQAAAIVAAQAGADSLC